jgi:OOP family OmpA-OmpF porin
MTFRKHPFAIALLGLATLLTQTTSQASEPGQDHPAVARYPGAVMDHYDFKEYEQAQLILSKPYKKGNALVADKLLPLEGAVTYLNYDLGKTVSALQVLRNYQSALRRSGFKELYVCERPCIDGNLSDLRPLLQARDLYLNGHQDIQYLAAQRGNTYVSLAVNSFGSGSSTYAWLFVIDKGALDDGKMAITGDSPIAKALSDTGRIDLYGFYFDTGKARLQAGSDKTLTELAQVLKDNPNLKVQVIGHTDNVGSDTANQQLSQERAQAVVEALSRQKGLAAERLSALGRGASQPVAPNSSEDGRARNRRVEIVALQDDGRAGAPAPTGSSANRNAPSGGGTVRPASPPATNSTPPVTSSDASDDKGMDGGKIVDDVVRSVRSLKDLFGR